MSPMKSWIVDHEGLALDRELLRRTQEAMRQARAEQLARVDAILDGRATLYIPKEGQPSTR